jgi:hypothetical protein
MRQLPFSFNSLQATKKVGPTHFLCPTWRSAKPNTSDNYIKWWESPLTQERPAAAPLLREVIADVREVVCELNAKKDHCSDHGDSDDCDDECVFDQPLSLFVP